MNRDSESKYKGFEADRSKYPQMEKDKPVIDLESQKFIKTWQGPQHPGVTGNMSVELIINGDEIVDAKTHVGYLHRGFENLWSGGDIFNAFQSYAEFVFLNLIQMNIVYRQRWRIWLG